MVEDGLVVLLCGIPFVVVPSVVGVKFVLFRHVFVSVGFGKYGGGSY